MFCCSGQDDSTKHKQQNNLSHTASNRSVVTQQPTSIKATISNNLSPQSTGVRSASHQQHQQRQQLQKKVQSRMSQHPRNKADVTIYEATDSSIDENQHKHDGATATVYEDSSKTDSQYDDADNEEEEEDADQDMDDYFDLTKLQPGQAHYPGSQWLLGPQPEHLKGRKCLILDLDETLVHSSFKFLRQADFVIPVDIDNQLHNVYVIKRPGVDEFMRRVGEIYEVVVFTASVSRYGDPLLDVLDTHKSIHHRLFRDSCFNYQNNYIKNLAQIGRPLSDIIILDNSPASYLFHPQHAIPISSWFSDAHDNELLDIMPFLEDLAKDNVEDIGVVLDINI